MAQLRVPVLFSYERMLVPSALLRSQSLQALIARCPTFANRHRKSKSVSHFVLVPQLL